MDITQPPAQAYGLAVEAEQAIATHNNCYDHDRDIGLLFAADDNHVIVWPTRRVGCMVREMVVNRGARWVGVAQPEEWDMNCPRDLSREKL